MLLVLVVVGVAVAVAVVVVVAVVDDDVVDKAGTTIQQYAAVYHSKQ